MGDLSFAVVGVGLMGSAFAQGLKKIGAKKVYGIDTDQKNWKKQNKETSLMKEVRIREMFYPMQMLSFFVSICQKALIL